MLENISYSQIVKLITAFFTSITLYSCATKDDKILNLYGIFSLQQKQDTKVKTFLHGVEYGLSNLDAKKAAKVAFTVIDDISLARANNSVIIGSYDFEDSGDLPTFSPFFSPIAYKYDYEKNMFPLTPPLEHDVVEMADYYVKEYYGQKTIIVYSFDDNYSTPVEAAHESLVEGKYDCTSIPPDTVNYEDLYDFIAKRDYQNYMMVTNQKDLSGLLYWISEKEDNAKVGLPSFIKRFMMETNYDYDIDFKIQNTSYFNYEDVYKIAEYSESAYFKSLSAVEKHTIIDNITFFIEGEIITNLMVDNLLNKDRKVSINDILRGLYLQLGISSEYYDVKN